MSTAWVVVAIVTITANAAIAAADVGGAEFVVANAGEVGLRPSWIPKLAVLKSAGALGLLVGLLGTITHQPVAIALGIAAAVGLVLFFVGAVVAHLRARVFHNIYYPASYLALAVASLALILAAT